MKFEVDAKEVSDARRLIYRVDEFSFDTERSESDGLASLLINDVQLELNDEGEVVSIWGLSPHVSWKRSQSLSPKDPVRGSVRLTDLSRLKPGIGTRLAEGRVETAYDEASGWVKIGSRSGRAKSIEIFEGAVIDLDADGAFAGLWLKPANALPA